METPNKEILIVEDSLVQAEVLRRLLADNGYTVHSAVNGLEGLEMAKKKRPALIISDIDMPEMDGYKLCHKIKNDPILKNTPLILLTQLSNQEDIILGLDSHADFYITKPYSKNFILSKVRSLLKALPLKKETMEEVAVTVAQEKLSSLDTEKVWKFLISVYENTKEHNNELMESQQKLQKTLDDLRKTQALLIRSEKLASIGTLSAGVAHEILNPLNIISATIQVLQLDPWPQEVKDGFEEIMAQTRRAVKITDNLRRFAHKAKAEIGPVNVHDLWDKTAALMEHDLKLENIRVEREYDENLPVIEADQDKLAQVFLNLLNNAKDAMKGREGKIINIKTQFLAEKIEVRFSDTGPGIPKELQPSIFDPFFTTKDPGKGTGLGLSVIHSIIESHNGSIRVESEEGKGASFIISLPVKRPGEHRTSENE